jgi:hypothetical protein
MGRARAHIGANPRGRVLDSGAKVGDGVTWHTGDLLRTVMPKGSCARRRRRT